MQLLPAAFVVSVQSVVAWKQWLQARLLETLRYIVSTLKKNPALNTQQKILCFQERIKPKPRL